MVALTEGMPAERAPGADVQARVAATLAVPPPVRRALFTRSVASGDVLAAVTVPTLVVHGRNDETVPVAGSRAWAGGKRHVRLVEVDDNHDLVVSLERIAAEADAHLAGLLGG